MDETIATNIAHVTYQGRAPLPGEPDHPGVLDAVEMVISTYPPQGTDLSTDELKALEGKILRVTIIVDVIEEARHE